MKAIINNKEIEIDNNIRYIDLVDKYQKYYEYNIVAVKENNVFEEEFLEEGRVYPSAITDFINIDFKSELAMTNALSISGDYIIRAVLEGYQTGKDEEKVPVYEKIYPIKSCTKLFRYDGSGSKHESVRCSPARHPSKYGTNPKCELERSLRHLSPIGRAFA